MYKTFLCGLLVGLLLVVAIAYITELSAKSHLTIETQLKCENGTCCDYYVIVEPCHYTIPRGFDCIGG